MIHTCDTCGKTGPWHDGWQWYGSYRDIDDGKPIYKACSQECMDQREVVIAHRRAEANLEESERELAEMEQVIVAKRAAVARAKEARK